VTVHKAGPGVKNTEIRHGSEEKKKKTNLVLPIPFIVLFSRRGRRPSAGPSSDVNHFFLRLLRHCSIAPLHTGPACRRVTLYRVRVNGKRLKRTTTTIIVALCHRCRYYWLHVTFISNVPDRWCTRTAITSSRPLTLTRKSITIHGTLVYYYYHRCPLNHYYLGKPTAITMRIDSKGHCHRPQYHRPRRTALDSRDRVK
jgi:hypothetical protein